MRYNLEKFQGFNKSLSCSLFTREIRTHKSSWRIRIYQHVTFSTKKNIIHHAFYNFNVYVHFSLNRINIIKYHFRNIKRNKKVKRDGGNWVCVMCLIHLCRCSLTDFFIDYIAIDAVNHHAIDSSSFTALLFNILSSFEFSTPLFI